jgi:hypothetical protein
MHLVFAICNECMLQAEGAKFSRRGHFQMLGDGCFARKKVELECLIAYKHLESCAFISPTANSRRCGATTHSTCRRLLPMVGACSRPLSM